MEFFAVYYTDDGKHWRTNSIHRFLGDAARSSEQISYQFKIVKRKSYPQEEVSHEKYLEVLEENRKMDEAFAAYKQKED